MLTHIDVRVKPKSNVHIMLPQNSPTLYGEGVIRERGGGLNQFLHPWIFANGEAKGLFAL